ncbi:MAG: MBL fold metallo-hydrolase [Clostridia bacterium]|nr:MBL fold metallo-hydrolase [Clostridia bacterium]
MTVSYYPVGALQANCVLLSDGNGHLAVVDPGDEAPRLLALLKRCSGTVEAILLTHVHFDHILATKALQEATGAPLLVHEADEPALSNEALSLIPPQLLPYSLTADRLLRDGDTVTVGEMVLEVLHTPGHTPGSCCYRCEDVLMAGDTLFAGSMGRTDLPGGDTVAMFHSLRRLSELPDELRVIAGHGEETTIGYERRYNPFLARN